MVAPDPSSSGEHPRAERVQVLERGRVAFAYRPRVEHQPGVQRFFMMLSPDGRALHRRLVVGKKRLPDVTRHEKEWAAVDKVVRSRAELYDDLGPSTYTTKTRGERHQPGVRHVADGAYAIVAHGDHVHLVHKLARPAERSATADALLVLPEASYVAAVFNPLAAWGTSAARGRHRPRETPAPFAEPSIYPDDVQAVFGERRFAPLAPALIDVPGAEIVLVGAHEDVALDLAPSLLASA